jgi:hypothetical protein
MSGMISQSGPGTSVESPDFRDAGDENSLRYEGWRVSAASGVGVFLSSLLIYTFAIFLKPIADEFSWSREQVSRAYSVAALTAGVCSALMLALPRYESLEAPAVHS